ncbi:uncharacterized protein [Aegilops tauschii subsp. strangulata]
MAVANFGNNVQTTIMLSKHFQDPPKDQEQMRLSLLFREDAEHAIKSPDKSLTHDSRVRVGAAVPVRMPCPNRTTALEKAIHGFADNLGDNVIVPTLGTTFDSLGEAYDFYNLYLWINDLALDTTKVG